jgi:hypothetical protein
MTSPTLGTRNLLSRDDHELLIYFESTGYRHLTAPAIDQGILVLDHDRCPVSRSAFRRWGSWRASDTCPGSGAAETACAPRPASHCS